MSSAAATWLHPLQVLLDSAGTIDWNRLDALATELDAVLTAQPVGADLPAGRERSRRLRLIRQKMAEHRELDTTCQPALFQLFAQFVCGYRDLDLRDATGLGHGRLIARHARSDAHAQWLQRLAAGDLAGIAVTEPHGGSRPADSRIQAVARTDGTWLVTGRKTWISRLTEAAVFVVFFRDPHGQLAAATIDATRPELHRQLILPVGLSGWTWGILDLDAVSIHPDRDVLHGDGMMLLREHFATYRPLVIATALGAAAAVFDTVASTLNGRLTAGDHPRLRDSSLIILGRAHAQLTTALLGACMATQLADTGHPHAELWSCALKAHGVDTANNATAELALLVGAAAFQASSPIAKTRRDLNGLLYADGIHDSLYIHAGLRHVAALPAPPSSRSPAEPIAG